MSRSELLFQMTRENARLRNQAARSVEAGMDALLDSKRTIQKLNLNEEESESILDSFTKMMNAGIALRVMLQVHKRHEQRDEAPWVDHKASCGELMRTALSFEQDADDFVAMLRQVLKETQDKVKNERKTPSPGLNQDQLAPAPAPDPS